MTSNGVKSTHADSRRSLLHSGHLGTVHSDPLCWQKWQIVQFCMNLRDFWP